MLQLKSILSLYSSASMECDEDFGITSHPKTASWKEETDCCSWDGVTCDGVKGDVIGLDLSCRLAASWENLFQQHPFPTSSPPEAEPCSQ